jgi:hypothetical protein
MAQVSGVVEAYSTKFDKWSIMVNDKWYNTKQEWAPKGVELTTLKGVEVEFDDGGKNYIKKFKAKGSVSGAPAKSGNKTWSNLGVELGHASNIARDICIQIHGKKAGSDEFYADFLEHTEKVFAVMKTLRDKYEKAPTPAPVPVKPAVSPEAPAEPASDDDDLF